MDNEPRELNIEGREYFYQPGNQKSMENAWYLMKKDRRNGLLSPEGFGDGLKALTGDGFNALERAIDRMINRGNL